MNLTDDGSWLMNSLSKRPATWSCQYRDKEFVGGDTYCTACRCAIDGTDVRVLGLEIAEELRSRSARDDFGSRDLAQSLVRR